MYFSNRYKRLSLTYQNMHVNFISPREKREVASRFQVSQFGLRIGFVDVLSHLIRTLPMVITGLKAVVTNEHKFFPQ